jgi:hypothetical protein
MDSSLARGLKKSLFEELNKEIDEAIEKFHLFTAQRNLSQNRNIWPKYYRDCEKFLHPFLISKFLGGSERKPLIGLTLFEPSESARNSWNEPCLSTTQMMIGHDPWCVKGVSGGFNIGEHAIHRLFQRGVSNEAVLTESRHNFDILLELKYASLWCGYWTLTCISRTSRLETEQLYPIIPTPSGLLLCEIHLKTLNRIEIRTFISESMLSSQQAELRNRMLETSEKMNGSAVVCAVGLCSLGRKDWMSDIELMTADIEPYSVALDQAAMRSHSI